MMARPTSTRPVIPSPYSTTTTITVETGSTSEEPPLPQIRDALVLKLKPPKKKVTWKEGTVDNEFMNRKSSKKCCIYHKEKPFDEDDSDGEGDCDHDHGDKGRHDGDTSEHSHENHGNS